MDPGYIYVLFIYEVEALTIASARFLRTFLANGLICKVRKCY